MVKGSLLFSSMADYQTYRRLGMQLDNKRRKRSWWMKVVNKRGMRFIRKIDGLKQTSLIHHFQAFGREGINLHSVSARYWTRKPHAKHLEMEWSIIWKSDSRNSSAASGEKPKDAVPNIAYSRVGRGIPAIMRMSRLRNMRESGPTIAHSHELSTFCGDNSEIEPPSWPIIGLQLGNVSKMFSLNCMRNCINVKKRSFAKRRVVCPR